MGKTKTVIIGEAPSDGSEVKPKVETHKELYEKSIAKKNKDVKIDESSTRTKEKLEAVPVATIKETTETAPEKEDQPKKSKPTDDSKKRKRFPRSKKYLENRKLVNKLKVYPLEEAVELVKKTSYAKFDATVELHIKTITKKNQDPVRGMVSLPSGSPKKKIVAIVDENLIQEIEKGKISFDILLTKPEMMPRLAKVAKILGPKGLMPSPKSGTVTEDPDTSKKELESGKVEYKTDALGNIHLAIGKVSWDDAKIIENIKTVVGAISSNRVFSVHIASSMGPGLKTAI